MQHRQPPAPNCPRLVWGSQRDLSAESGPQPRWDEGIAAQPDKPPRTDDIDLFSLRIYAGRACAQSKAPGTRPREEAPRPRAGSEERGWCCDPHSQQMGRETRAGVPAFFIPRTPNRPPCGREEWTPDSTPHVIHIFLLGCFLFWQSGQKSGRRSLWLSPLALRSPEEGTGLGIWSGQVKHPARAPGRQGMRRPGGTGSPPARAPERRPVGGGLPARP